MGLTNSVISYQLSVISLFSEQLSDFSFQLFQQFMDINKTIADQKSYQFAIRVVKAYKYLTDEKKEYVLSK